MQQKLDTYWAVLAQKSEAYGIPLKDAFAWKDISEATYYRAKADNTVLRYATAKEVNHALEELKALKKHRARLEAQRKGDAA